MTREEAVEVLKERYLTCVGIGLDNHANRVNEALDMAIEALQWQDRILTQDAVEDEWIPCSERLPEEYGEYLVTKRTIGWNCEEYGSNDIAYFDSDGFHKADKVTAWMPLPEPYKGGEKE